MTAWKDRQYWIHSSIGRIAVSFAEDLGSTPCGSTKLYLTYNSVTKRRNTINIIPKANRNVDDVVSTIDAFIDKYYPDIQYDLSISGDKIVITVK